MGFSCGIVGLPNVGKSTLFNALLAQQQAEAANYPFCTIEPNTGRVAVPDIRLDTIARLANSAVIIPTQLEFVDIAGLVRGASKGEGLGNQFLSHIREVDAIIYMLRCFEDDDITHVEGSVQPMRDFHVVETELLLADLESLEKRKIALEKKRKQQDKEALTLLPLIDQALEYANEGKALRLMMKNISSEEKKLIHSLNLLTSKPALVVCNVEEDAAASGNALSAEVAKECDGLGLAHCVISARIESDIAMLETADEKKEFLEAMGLARTGLTTIIEQGYKLLDLITFFTVGPKEARAWTLRTGSKAPAAAGCIHTDFEKGFIRAETIAHADYVACGGESGAKEAGKFRLEGKEYVTQDGDIFHFRFNV